MSDYKDIDKRARILEGQLELKLSGLNRICSDPKPKMEYIAPVHTPIKVSPMAVASAKAEIEVILHELSSLNTQMPSLQMNQRCQTSIRHNEILRDYQKEFRKILENYEISREREALLATKNTVTSWEVKSDTENTVEFLQSSNILIDSTLQAAIDAKTNLASQRRSLKRIQTRLRDLYHSFPMINNLIRRADLANNHHYIVLFIILLFLCIVLTPKYMWIDLFRYFF